MAFRPPGIDPDESLQDFMARADQSYEDNAHISWQERYLRTLQFKQRPPAELQMLRLLRSWRSKDHVWYQVHLMQLLEMNPQAVADFNQWWIQAAPKTDTMQAGLSTVDSRRWKVLNLISKLSLDFVIADASGSILFAIELNGASHGAAATAQQQQNDAIKHLVLGQLGIPLAQVDNQDVLNPARHALLQQRMQTLP